MTPAPWVSAVLASLVLVALLAGCTRPTPDEPGLVADVTTAYDESPFAREGVGTTHGHDRGRLPAGTPAEGGILLVMIRQGSRTPTDFSGESDPSCTSPIDCSNIAEKDTYRVSDRPGTHRYPLGPDGAASLLFPASVYHVAITVEGPLAQPPTDCPQAFYMGDTAVVESEPPAGHAMHLTQDTALRIPYVVWCYTDHA